MARQLHCLRPLNFPVTKCGVYANRKERKLEYWFFFNGRKAKVGECRMDVPDAMKIKWEEFTNSEVQKLLVDKFGAKPIILGTNGERN